MPKPLHRAIVFYQPDEPLDEDSMMRPLNPLPVSCPECSMTDLRFVHSPYLLRKAAANAAGDYGIAYVGNFLVKQHVRDVIQFVAPGSCDFFPTALQRGSGQSPWLLATPRHFSEPDFLAMQPGIKSCAVCGEPLEQNMHLVVERNPDLRSAEDLAKSPQWFSWDRKGFWVLAVMTVRMHALFQRLGWKGRWPDAERDRLVPTSDEQQWVEQQLGLLRETGLAQPATAPSSEDRLKWFDFWLRRKRAKRSPVTVQAFEDQSQIKLPRSFVRFAEKAGAMTFRNVEDNGLEAIIMAQPEVHVPEGDEQFAGTLVRFAETNCGDSFCFHFADPNAEPVVLRHHHELFSFEPYADDFIACLRRFAGYTD